MRGTLSTATNWLLLQVHATKTGHQKFSESTEAVKPLTDEEKAAQLKRLSMDVFLLSHLSFGIVCRVEERLKQKRLERQEKEKEVWFVTVNPLMTGLSLLGCPAKREGT